MNSRGHQTRFESRVCLHLRRRDVLVPCGAREALDSYSTVAIVALRLAVVASTQAIATGLVSFAEWSGSLYLVKFYLLYLAVTTNIKKEIGRAHV